VRDLLDKESAVLFAGWDWASASHAITVIDAAGRVVDRATLTHTEAALDAALSRLAAHARPGDLPVAIEATNGLVVDRLLAAGHPVIAVHATAFHAARPRWSASGAKSDPGDSYKLADYLRTDGHRLRRLQPPDAATRELQALVRLRGDHLAAKTTTSNQLWALLGRTGPLPGRFGSGWRPRSRWTSSPTTRPHRPPPASPNSSWRGSAADTPPAAARPPPSCWIGCGQLPPHQADSTPPC
jgi:hypothetical protein